MWTIHISDYARPTTDMRKRNHPGCQLNFFTFGIVHFLAFLDLLLFATQYLSSDTKYLPNTFT